MRFDSWEVAIAHLDDLAGRLRKSGASEAADELHAVLHKSAWTTSSELLGEIKLSLVEARRKNTGKLSPALRKDIDAFIAFVDEAWNNANR